MNSLLKAVIFGAALAALIISGAPNAHAAILLQENFESYADDAAIFGTTVGADGGRTGGPWTNGNKEAGSVDGIHLNTDGVNVPLTTGQNVKRVPNNASPSTTDGVGQGRTGHGFAVTTPSASEPLSIKWSFFDNGDHTTAVSPANSVTYSKVPFSVMDLKNSLDQAVLQVGLSPVLNQFGTPSNVNTFQASINGGSTAINLATLRPAVPAWTTFELITIGTKASLYVNGSLTPDANFNNLTIAAPAGGGGFAFDRIRVGSGSTTEGVLLIAPTVWTAYDNIEINSVPEPGSSLLVLWSAGLMLLGHRRFH